MTVSLLDVAKAIKETAIAADPGVLNGYEWLYPAPVAPAVVVTVEFDYNERKTMDQQHFDMWRVWVLLSNADSVSAAEQLYEYIDDRGDRSIPAQFNLSTAVWRNYSGISQIAWYGFARLPSSIQGPGLVSFGGPEYWGAPLLFQVLYG